MLQQNAAMSPTAGLMPQTGTGSSSSTSGGSGHQQGQKESNLEGLEFDGDTVLCRVCGDKASGFHYGVHACEGCKGFFRRSIQQKIQYRPCLKNQQCNIMRVNRNRCQYCRLKKCIAVGMSRDAVRFGRVPKKEKAKIMEQMHKVNSQSQVTLLNTVLESSSDITQKIVEAHVRTCDFTQTKLRAFLEKAWQSPQFVNCPAHMACPLNPSPETSDGTKKWDEFSECFTPAIRNVVNFAKCIPGFQILSQEDQVTLLKAGTFEVLLVHLACLFDAQTNTMCFANGKLYKRVSLTVTNSAGFLLDSMFDFAERLNTMQLSDEEIALFSAIVIIAADRPGLRNVEQVERVQNRITQALQALMSSKHPDDPALFAKLLMKIPDLRTLNTLHSEKLLGLTVPAGSGKNGGSVEKPRTVVEGQGPFYPGGMMPGGFPMFGGPMVPGHLRDPSMQYPVHPPDVPGIIPHQMTLDSTHQNHSVVLQTPLGTFHRYNSALQQNLSMNRSLDFPQQATRQGECPVTNQRDRQQQEDVKSNEFSSMPKFKTEDAVHSAIQNQVKEQQRALREEVREAHSRSEAVTPASHEGSNALPGEISRPKHDVSLQHAGLSTWPGLPRKHPFDRSIEQRTSPEYSDHSEAERIHKRRSNEDEESISRKAPKFWSEAGRSAICPVTSAYAQRMTSSLHHSVPGMGLHNPTLMTMYQKETMLQFHHHQQHYEHQQKQQQVNPQNHSPKQPQFSSDESFEEQRNYAQESAQRQSPEIQYDRSKLEKDLSSSSSFQGDANTNINLPELKSALSRPPLSSPGWSSSERKSSLSETESAGENVTKPSDEDQRTTSSQHPTSFDSYFVHKKLKMKRRGSSETVSSDGSVQEQECRSPISRHYPVMIFNSGSVTKTESSGGQESQEAQRTLGDKDIREIRLQEQICRGQDANANDILSVDSDVGIGGRAGGILAGSVSSGRSIEVVPSIEPVASVSTTAATAFQSSQFAKESSSKEPHQPPTISLIDDETSEKVGLQSAIRLQQRSTTPPPFCMKYNIDDSSITHNKEANLRQNNHRAQYDSNASKYYNSDVINSRMEESKTISTLKSSPGHHGGSSLPSRLQNGLCGSSPYPPVPGVAPHPAYLPLPFPPMHPALMYQYNMAAAHQMAQLQQLQLAQAQMAIHHQVNMSKSEGPHQGSTAVAALPQGEDDLTQPVGRKSSDDDLAIKETSSDTSRERHPLNLSKSQDTVTTNQNPVFVKPEPM